MAESTEARVQALIEQIRIFARLRIQETKTAASEDFRATEQHFDKLESALRAELGKDAERLDAKRYQWLKPRLVGADFDFQESGQTVLVFDWPNTPISAECDETFDAAIQQTKDTK